jgi:hypothetical protein
MYIERQTMLRKAQLFHLLEQHCQRLEPTANQLERAQTSYEAVGRWLAAADDQWLSWSSIYLQGSTAVGTTVKPIGQYEHDVDLVCHIPGLGCWATPAQCKHLVGARLRANQRYADILEEKPRCWRLNYAGDFHLDITPSIPNAACVKGGELVPDKLVRSWKATNPKGYRDAFKARAELVPQMRLLKSFGQDSTRADADIDPFPEQPRFRGVLCRIVQILKRHRDVFFDDCDASVAPISVIITTLAAWSYEHCVHNMVFDSELDVLCTVVEHMPHFIQREIVAGRVQWLIPNDTTAGENFAERWNSDPALATAFFEWHAAAEQALRSLMEARGLDGLSDVLAKAFGQAPSAEVMKNMVAGVTAARVGGSLGLAPRIGLTATAPVTRVTPVRANTFFGAP